MMEYRIQVNEEGRNYPHYWEQCVGSCHAATVLREDVREQIRKAHKECGFQYLRFHGLFDDDMSVYFKELMGRGPAVISFFNIDSIFDFLLEIGMKPFVEIGFMPEALASGKQTCFHYKGNVTPPADYEEWDNLIRQFGEHLLERYGKEEVSRWFFEVWNEPNLNFFFDGTQEDYFELYEHTARALKSVDECFRVGGPATSVNAWITPFRTYCESNQVPLDFITTHHYPSDDPLSTMGMNGPGTKGATFDEKALEAFQKMSEEERQKAMASMFNRENKNPRDILLQMTRKAKEEAGDYPLYYTEWNGSREFDTSYQAAFVAQTLAYNEGLVEGYSFWTVSDIFEEMGLLPAPFKNAFGIQTNHGVEKPVYRVFQALHEAGDRRLDVKGEGHPTAEVLALTDGKTVTILAYNHDLERRNIQPEEIKLILDGRVTKIEKAVIDDSHCNPLKTWEEMGSPLYLKKEQLAELKQAAGLEYEELPKADADSQEICFTAQPESVTIFRIRLA